MFKLERPKQPIWVAVARDSVGALLVERIDPVRTAFAVLGFGAATFLVVVIASFSSFCPLCGFGSPT